MDWRIWLLIVAVLGTGALALFICQKKKSSDVGDAILLDSEEWGLPQTVIWPAEEIAEPATEILLGTSEGRPIIRICEAVESLARTPTDREPISDGEISRLNALISLAGPALVEMNSRGNLMHVEVSVPLARAVGSEGFRGFVMRGGKIIEHAVLEPSSIGQIATGNGVWQLASVIVAQKHLADISEKLGAIQDQVEGIQNWLDSKRRSEITSSIDYLKQIAEPVLAGHFDAAIRDQLEHHEAQLMSVQKHLDASLQLELRALDNFQGTDWFGSLEVTTKLRASHAKIEALSEQWLMAHAARAAALQLLTVTGAPEPIVDARGRDIEAGFKRFRDERLPTHATYFEKKIGMIDATFNRQSTLDERRSSVKKLVYAFMSRAQDTLGEIEIETRRQEAISAACNGLITFEVQLEGDSVKRATLLNQIA